MRSAPPDINGCKKASAHCQFGDYYGDEDERIMTHCQTPIASEAREGAFDHQ
jgi:hypothetical protein